MDAQRLMELGPLLAGFLGEFADCFGRSEQRSHLRTFVLGQLSDLQRKTLEPVALAGGVPPRTLQHFLSRHGWDHGLLRDRLQQRVAHAHPHPHSIGIIDETAHVKKGDKTPGTQRQYCGNRGTIDNCVVTVHLGYAAGDFHALLDAELYLPESWSTDRARCRAAGIPDGVVYRPKADIALELLDRAVANGLRFEWLAVDAGYGMDRGFLNRLQARGQRFVAEAPGHFFGWVRRPAVMHQEFKGRASYEHSGRHRKFPRLKVKSPRACSVDHLLSYSPTLRDQPWRRYYIKDTQKGPVVWEVRHAPFYFKLEKAITFAHWLVVCRSPVTGEVKFFVSNASLGTPLEAILHVAFNRWHVEQCFLEEKSDLGMSHFEVRNYRSLLRHMILTSATHLFLAEVKERWRAERGEWRAPDHRPAAHGDDRGGPQSVAEWSGAPESVGIGGREDRLRPEEHRRRDPVA